MRPPLHQRLVDKSAAAVTAAVEVYNKPAFAYREETFAILALTRPTKAGAKSKKLYVKYNRAGNPQTISLHNCINKLEATAAKLPPEIKANLDALTAIRDNSVHFVTASATLARQAQEAGAVVVSADESRLIEHLRTVAQEVAESDGPYAVAVRLQVKLEKSSLATASKVQITKDEDAVKVQLSEQDIREKYPWDYNELCARLGARYADFKQNQGFHDIRLPLLVDERYAKPRYLDPGNPKSPKKDFYNSNVLQVFDQKYLKRTQG